MTMPLRVRGLRVIATGAVVLGAGCTGAGSEASPAPSDGAWGGHSVDVAASCTMPEPVATHTERDVQYATTDPAQRMDLAWPTTPGPHPMVILLHGGSWTGGSRTAMHDDMMTLAGQGYVAASASYRLTTNGRHRFPAAVQDVRCAVRWLRTNAHRFGGDPDRVGAIGFSAGGHLASMLGTASDVSGLDQSCGGAGGSAGVQAVVSHAGPQDLRVVGTYTDEQASIVTEFLGAFPGEAPELAALASPIVHVTRGDAAFLLVHGTRDGLVPYAHARRMRDTLRAAGVPATVLTLRGQGHVHLPIRSSRDARVGCTTLAFLSRWLGASPDSSR